MKSLIRHFIHKFIYTKKYPSLRISSGVSLYDCVFGKHNIVYQNALLYNSSIGSFTYVGANCKIKNAEIGKFCSIGEDVKIGLGIHPTNLKSTHPGFYAKDSSYYGFEPTEKLTIPEYRQVKIGNDVWIGTNAIILDGVTIGDGAVVGAGAVVTKDILPYAIVGGVPAKLIRYRFDEETIASLVKEQWWNASQYI